MKNSSSLSSTALIYNALILNVNSKLDCFSRLVMQPSYKTALLIASCQSVRQGQEITTDERNLEIVGAIHTWVLDCVLYTICYLFRFQLHVFLLLFYSVLFYY